MLEPVTAVAGFLLCFAQFPPLLHLRGMDKFTILNNALVASGNDPLEDEDDTVSAEYIAANTAFERNMRFLTARHSWMFATTTFNLEASDDDNPSKRYPDYVFDLPDEALHVVEAYFGNYPTTSYEIMGRLLSAAYDADISIKAVIAVEDTALHPVVEEILTLYVEAGCYSALNENPSMAANKKNEAEMLLMEARPHVDQQNPARNIYKSSIRAARRTRRV